MSVRAADVLLGLAALALLALLFGDWFAAPGASAAVHTTGWSALGWATVALLVLCIALALATVVLLEAGVKDSVNLIPAVPLAALAPLTLLVTLVVVALQPGLGAGLPNDAVTIRWPAWAGLAALLILAIAAWWSLHDDRLHQSRRQVPPPAPRPAPPAS